VDGPHASDLVIRPSAGSEFGVFVVMTDRGEHPLRAFHTYTEALSHATQLAAHVHVDVWQADSVGPPTQVASHRPRLA
jgi:hypothetical protein